MMEHESLYSNPEEILQAAEQQGIIKLGEMTDELPFDLPTHAFPVCIIDPSRWIDFLQDINAKTNNPGEKMFVQGLIQSFEAFCKGSGFEVEKVKKPISEEDVSKFKEKLNNIKTIDELLKEIDS